MSSDEALEVCGWKGRVVGVDSCAVPRQVAELVVEGCSTTSSADCRSAAADVMPASPIPVLRFGEYGGTFSACRRSRCDDCVMGISSIRM